MNEKQRQYIEQLKAQQNLKEEYQQPINMPDERAAPVQATTDFALGVMPPNPNDMQALQGVYPGLLGAGAFKAGQKIYDVGHNMFKRTENVRNLVIPYQSMKVKEQALPFDTMTLDARGREVFKTGLNPTQQRVYDRLIVHPRINSRTTPRGAYRIMYEENQNLGKIQMQELAKLKNVKIDADMELRSQIDNAIKEAFENNPALSAELDANMRQLRVMMNGINKDINKFSKGGQLTPYDVENMRRRLDNRMESAKGAKFTDGDGNETPLYILWMEARSAMNSLVDRRAGTTLFHERRKAMSDYFEGMKLTQGRGARTGATPKQRAEQVKETKQKAQPIKMLGRYRSFFGQ